MSKLHMMHLSTEKGMPTSLVNHYRDMGLHGSLCGYMRKTTTVKSKVTCSHCQKRMQKIARSKQDG